MVVRGEGAAEQKLQPVNMVIFIHRIHSVFPVGEAPLRPPLHRLSADTLISVPQAAGFATGGAGSFN
jgi:hypothetical protein